MNFWDRCFSEPGFKYGTQPNAYLQAQASKFQSPARVLVPGDGEGRNGVWLAEQGHDVLSVDNSFVGLKKAAELASSRGVKLATALVDLSDWTPPQRSFDAVILIYTHLPNAIRQRAHRALARGLKPGGLLLLEAFHPGQLAFSSGGPKDSDMLYSPELLNDDFAGLFKGTESWQGEVDLSEGPGHQGRAHVTRWLGLRLAD